MARRRLDPAALDEARPVCYTGRMAVHPDLVSLVRCPKCHGELKLTDGEKGFACHACKLLYPIVDDIPQLLTEEAKPLEARSP